MLVARDIFISSSMLIIAASSVFLLQVAWLFMSAELLLGVVGNTGL